MNLAEMTTFVREQADTDEVDASTSKLTVYARAAYRDIQGRVFPWPDKKTTYEFSTVVGVQNYAVAGLTGGSNMEFVLLVRRADEVLDYVSPDRFTDLAANSTGNGTPTVYTVDSGIIKLWPTPAAAVGYFVDGFRSFNEWPSGSDQPDLPRGFDEVICWYMLSKFYQSQEDLELAQMYMRDYEYAVNQQIEKALRTSAVSAGPRIFGGDPALHGEMSYQDWVKRGVEG